MENSESLPKADLTSLIKAAKVMTCCINWNWVRLRLEPFYVVTRTGICCDVTCFMLVTKQRDRQEMFDPNLDTL